MAGGVRAPAAGEPRPRQLGAAGWAALAACGLVVAAVVTGAALNARGVPLFAGAAPLFGEWLPHAGPGTPVALVIAALAVARGPELAVRLPWRWLLAAGYATAVAWTFALAMVDGWQRGLAGRLTTGDEYLHEVPGVRDAGATVRGFAGRILDFQPDSWTVHVAGHPPGALLAFVGLDRAGLGGGGAAAFACVLVGATTAVSVPVTLRALGAAGTARAAVPLLALFPGAVWVGASADGLFAGVVAGGVALLALATADQPGAGGVRRDGLALAGGVLVGLGPYLSYGLVLYAPLVLAVALAARRSLRSLLIAAAGAALVVAAFTAAGFWWLDGYHLVVQRYYQGIAAQRPYGYWVWANLACLVLAAGPGAAAGITAALRRPVGAPRADVPARRPGGLAVVGLNAAFRRPTAVRGRPAGITTVLRRAAAGPSSAAAAVRCLVLAAVVAVLVADVSGLSKAETERIWLPFAVWLTAGAAALPHPRRWLAAGAVTALLVNHLVLTGW